MMLFLNSSETRTPLIIQMKSSGALILKTQLYLLLLFLLQACTSSVKQEDLYGTWKYTKVENPNQTPPHSASEEELKENDPSIIFTSKGELKMIWGGKVLSHGTFKLEYPTIAYKEDLPGGSKRDIRFLIKKFDGKELVFETMEADAVRVTAKK